MEQLVFWEAWCTPHDQFGFITTFKNKIKLFNILKNTSWSWQLILKVWVNMLIYFIYLTFMIVVEENMPTCSNKLVTTLCLRKLQSINPPTWWRSWHPHANLPKNEGMRKLQLKIEACFPLVLTYCTSTCNTHEHLWVLNVGLQNNGNN